MNYNHESDIFKNAPNKRAKLRNALNDINWYAYRFCAKYSIEANSKNAISVIEKMVLDNRHIPLELNMILVFAKKLSNAVPDNANEIFYDCWRFLHNNFDQSLNT